MIEESVLVLPDHTKVFEVHIDALDFAIRGVLMQDRYLITFESCKLNDTEKRYTCKKRRWSPSSIAYTPVNTIF